MIQLTRFERDDFLEYLGERTGSPWFYDEENAIWLRLNEDTTLCYALKIVAPAEPGPFAMWSILTIPGTDTAPEATVTDILRYWTSYQRRQYVALFLRDELKHDAETATAAAIIICRLLQEDEHIVADLLQQPKLPGAVPRYATDEDVRINTDRMSRTWQLPGGGHVALALAGGQFRIDLSAKTPGVEGYRHFLRGYVRSIYNRYDPRDVAADLFHWSLHERESKSDNRVPEMPTPVLLEVREGPGTSGDPLGTGSGEGSAQGPGTPSEGD
jgi:hypothetical protein